MARRRRNRSSGRARGKVPKLELNASAVNDGDSKDDGNDDDKLVDKDIEPLVQNSDENQEVPVPITSNILTPSSAPSFEATDPCVTGNTSTLFVSAYDSGGSVLVSHSPGAHPFIDPLEVSNGHESMLEEELCIPSPSNMVSVTLEVNEDGEVSINTLEKESFDIGCIKTEEVDCGLNTIDEDTGQSQHTITTTVSPKTHSHQLSPDFVCEVEKTLNSGLPPDWFCKATDNGFNVMLLSRCEEKAIQRRIFFPFTGGLHISIHRKALLAHDVNKMLEDIKPMGPLTENHYQEFLDLVGKVIGRIWCMEICGGADQNEYEDLWSSENGEVDVNPYGEKRYTKTFRSPICKLLVNSQRWRCGECCKLLTSLRRKRAALKPTELKMISKQKRKSNVHPAKHPTKDMFVLKHPEIEANAEKVYILNSGLNNYQKLSLSVTPGNTYTLKEESLSDSISLPFADSVTDQKPSLPVTPCNTLNEGGSAISSTSSLAESAIHQKLPISVTPGNSFILKEVSAQKPAPLPLPKSISPFKSNVHQSKPSYVIPVPSCSLNDNLPLNSSLLSVPDRKTYQKRVSSATPNHTYVVSDGIVSKQTSSIPLKSQVIDLPVLKDKVSSALVPRIEMVSKQEKHDPKAFITKKIRAELEKYAVPIEEDLDNDLNEILKSCTLSAVQQQFMDVQTEVNNRKKTFGKRWHPILVRYALMVKSTSKEAASGVITLRCGKSLFNFSQVLFKINDFQMANIDDVCEKYALKSCDLSKLYLVLLLDEVDVRGNLVFQRSNGELIGFVKLSDVRTEVDHLEAFIKNGKAPSHPPKSYSMLIYLTKSVSQGMKEIVGIIDADHLSKDILYEKTWNIIGNFEQKGIKILAVVSNGSPRIKDCIQLHTAVSKLESGLVFSTINLKAPNRLLYFFVDACYMLKEIRNCFELSGSPSTGHQRHLTKGIELIVWKTIVKLYLGTKWKCPNLNAQNVFLNEYSRKRPCHAYAVLSDKVASSLQQRVWPFTDETVNFLTKVHDFFNCILSVEVVDGNTPPEPFPPFSGGEDQRFAKMLEFLAYLRSWEAEVDEKCDLSSSEKAKLMLDKDIYYDLEVTVNAFMHASSFLWKEGINAVDPNVFWLEPVGKFLEGGWFGFRSTSYR